MTMGLHEADSRSRREAPANNHVTNAHVALPAPAPSPGRPTHANPARIAPLCAPAPASPDSAAFNHNPVHWGAYRSYAGGDRPPFAPGAGDRLTIIRIADRDEARQPLPPPKEEPHHPPPRKEEPQKSLPPRKEEPPASSPVHHAPNGQLPTPVENGYHLPTWNPYRQPMPPGLPLQQPQTNETPIIRRRRAQSPRSSIDCPSTPISPGPVPKRHSAAKRPSLSLSKDGNAPLSSTSSNRSFPCPLTIYGCTSTFGSKNEWKRHVNTQHMRLGFWRCDMCPNGDRKPNDFNRKDLFIQHVRRMHPSAASRTEATTIPPKAGKDNESMQALQDAANRCYKALRHPPQHSCCLFCEQQFTGNGSWDDRMEHVGRHLELTRREGQLPPDPQEWAPDDAVNQWMVKERIIFSHGQTFVLDDQNSLLKPIIRPIMNPMPRYPPPLLKPPVTNGHVVPEKIIATDVYGRASSPKRRFDPVHDAVRHERSRSGGGTEAVLGAIVQTQAHPQMNGVEPEAVRATPPKPEDKLPEMTAKVKPPKKSTSEDADPYLALFSAINGNDEEIADVDKTDVVDDGEHEESNAEAGATVGEEDGKEGSFDSEVDHRPNTPADSVKDKDDTSYYSTFKNRTWGAVQAIGRLFGGPRPDSEMGSAEPEDMDGKERSPSPVAKRTRSARAKGEIVLEGNEEESERGSPPRKRTRQSVISSRS